MVTRTDDSEDLPMLDLDDFPPGPETPEGAIKTSEDPTLAPALAIDLTPSNTTEAPRGTPTQTGPGEVYWKCGRCNRGPWLLVLYTQCLDCSHVCCLYDCSLAVMVATEDL